MLKKIRHHWIANFSANKSTKPRVELIGAPDDRGILNVGGRLGANRGPEAVRRMFADFALGINGEIEKIELSKGRDITLGESIAGAHAEIRRQVAENAAASIRSIVIGGGHDYGFPHVAGISDFYDGKVGLLNVDAHLDVRPVAKGVITSGSPFWLMLEEKAVLPANFIEFGIQPHCNDKSFIEYLRRKKVKIVMLAETRKSGPVKIFEKNLKNLISKKIKVVVSFDLDAVQMAHAPGVSAPQSEGFTATEFLEMVAICGRYPQVVSIGFFELAPDLDVQNMTTRLVATAIHRYLSALAQG